MKRVLVRYRVRPDRADENQPLVEKVFEQLKTDRPVGLRYKAFTQDIAERCDEPPVAMGMAEIGSYRFLGE